MSQSIFHLSQYWLDEQHPGYSLLYDLVVLFESFGAQPIYVAENTGFIYRKRPFRWVTHKYLLSYGTYNKSALPDDAVLFVTCYTPDFLLSLQCFESNYFKFKKVVVYLLDGFDSRTVDGFGPKIFKGVDTVFVIMEEAVEDLRQLGVNNVYFMPFGVDALKHSPHVPEKTIDVFSFGRIDTRYHPEIEPFFSSPESHYFYLYGSMQVSSLVNQAEHRRLHWKLLLNSRVSFCFESSRIPRFCQRSPILYRWFECIAAGVVAVGTTPKCSAVSTMLNWPDSTIEVPKDPGDFLTFMTSLLEDKERLRNASLENRYQALARHDWRYRFRDMFTILALDLPENLCDQLPLLLSEAARVQALKDNDGELLSA